MQQAKIVLHTGFQIAQVDPRLFGGFLEHLGRAVYGGVYEPESPHADALGCRSDVLAALEQLQMTLMRYPGGNFASGYHWMDGVGPRGQRPVVRELAWQSIETNQFGTDEFIALCRRMGWAPMLTVNLGTGTPEEARNWVEYCNCPGGTRYADMRARSGAHEPHGVKLWCLGNEMDGRWQLGHAPAEQYAIRAQQAAKMMKDTDTGIELVACGSSGPSMSTFTEWDRQVLEYLGGFADYISLHRYVGNQANDTADYLAITNDVDRQIEEIDAVCRFVQARHRSAKRTFLCFDEWNVWYRNMESNGAGKYAPHLLEEVYNLEDALVVAGFLHSFVRHADSVKIANLAQIVNVIAPILTRGDEMLIQSIFHPFRMFAARRNGTALRLLQEGASYESRSHGRAAFLDASAILDGASLHLFASNRSMEHGMDLSVGVADASVAKVVSAEVVAGSDPKAGNSFANPELVAAREFSEHSVVGGALQCRLPPLSFTAMTLKLG